jgi:H+/Cl- antiporter ClcA
MREKASRVLGLVRPYLVTFVRWTLLSLVMGALCGVVGAAFHHAVSWAGEIFGEYGWFLFLLPVAGLAITALYRVAGLKKDPGTNLVLAALQSGEPVPVRMAPLIFVSTALTQLCGGSAGREGAALQIGAGLSTLVGRLFRLEDKEAKSLTVCGMSGLFAAVFGTPVTAAVFSLEVSAVGVFHYAMLYPCVLASLVAWEISKALGSSGTAFALSGVPEETAASLLRLVALALLCALCSILFLWFLHLVEGLYRKTLKNPYLRVVGGGFLVAALTLLVGTRDYNGAGMAVVSRVLSGETVVPWAFLLKILFTALTIGAGFKGGEIVPTFMIGATFGAAVGPVLGLDPVFAAAVGLVTLFCCVVNCPMASIVLAVELFGGAGLPFFALACGLGYLMSGYFTLYAQQRIIYAKPEK